jgi:hypothetical protein
MRAALKAKDSIFALLGVATRLVEKRNLAAADSFLEKAVAERVQRDLIRQKFKIFGRPRLEGYELKLLDALMQMKEYTRLREAIKGLDLEAQSEDGGLADEADRSNLPELALYLDSAGGPINNKNRLGPGVARRALSKAIRERNWASAVQIGERAANESSNASLDPIRQVSEAVLMSGPSQDLVDVVNRNLSADRKATVLAEYGVLFARAGRNEVSKRLFEIAVSEVHGSVGDEIRSEEFAAVSRLAGVLGLYHRARELADQCPSSKARLGAYTEILAAMSRARRPGLHYAWPEFPEMPTGTGAPFFQLRPKETSNRNQKQLPR